MQFSEFRFAFHAKDFSSSVAFYRDTLGMDYVGGWDRPDGKGALLSAGGAAVVEIYGAAEGQSYDGPAPSAVNLALRLDNTSEVDAVYQMLSSEWQSIEGPPEDRPWGHRSFIVHDPDDLPIHIYCELD